MLGAAVAGGAVGTVSLGAVAVVSRRAGDILAVLTTLRAVRRNLFDVLSVVARLGRRCSGLTTLVPARCFDSIGPSFVGVIARVGRAVLTVGRVVDVLTLVACLRRHGPAVLTSRGRMVLRDAADVFAMVVA